LEVYGAENKTDYCQIMTLCSMNPQWRAMRSVLTNPPDASYNTDPVLIYLG